MSWGDKQTTRNGEKSTQWSPGPDPEDRVEDR